MRPRNLALAGLALAALSTSAFLLLDQPPQEQVMRTIPFENETRTLSESNPDPAPHAFAVHVPRGASNAWLEYYCELASEDRTNGQEQSIRVQLVLYVDGERATDGDHYSSMSYGRSSNTMFSTVWGLDVDLIPGFHVVQMRIDTTDQMTEPWEWTFTAHKAELHYQVSNGWRGGPLPLVGLIAGLAVSVVLWGWAIKRAVQVPEPPA